MFKKAHVTEKHVKILAKPHVHREEELKLFLYILKIISCILRQWNSKIFEVALSTIEIIQSYGLHWGRIL